MASAPNRYEVERLHRSMMQASLEAAQLDRRLQEDQKSDGISGELKHWHDAADVLQGAVERSRAALLADGTPEARVDRIRGWLLEIKSRAENFEIENDLEDCVGHWKALGRELGQVVGSRRDALVGLLESRKARIDQTTAFLSQAKQSDGLAPEKHRKVLQLTRERDRAREKYEGLRQQYIEAERDCQIAEQQEAKEEAAAQEHQMGSVPVPNLATLAKKGPVLVRLPVEEKKPAAASSDAKNAKAEPVEPQVVKQVAFPQPLEKKSPSQAQQAVLPKPDTARAGPPQVAVERVEKVAGYATAMDGIGRGAQTAQIYFRANDLDGVVQMPGAAAVQLGCAVRLDVLPSVQIFPAAAGAPLRGKLSLALVSSGGRLGTVQPRNALDSAKQAASQAAAAIAGKLGDLGKPLQPALEDVLEDAAAKIFGPAASKAAPNKLPVRAPGAQSKASAVDDQVARFNHALGSIIVESRAVKGGQTQKLGALLERDHRRDAVADRLEQTMANLATAPHRTLTDPTAGEMRSQLARMDSILARVKGKSGQEKADGAQELGQILQQMGSIAASKGGAPHRAELRKQIEERRGQLKQIMSPSQSAARLPEQSKASTVRQLSELRKHDPGLDKLLKNASRSQLGTYGLGGQRLGGIGGGNYGALAGLEEKQKSIAPKTQQHEGPTPAHITADALLQVFKEHPKGSGIAQHLAAGGALRSLCEAAQRGQGLPMGKLAQHYLAARGSSRLWNAVQTFHSLVKEGHKPHFRRLGSIAAALKETVSGAIQNVSKTVGNVEEKAQGFAAAATETVKSGVSCFGNNAMEMRKGAVSNVQNLGGRALGGRRSATGRMKQAKDPWAAASLEKVAGKGLKRGIWVSGRAAQAQAMLDKVLGAGDTVHGVLSQVHELAPGLADLLGDNAAGHLVSQVGDLAGKGNDKLAKALDCGHGASDTLSQYRGYLDKGLGYGGVKDPQKAFERMQARKDLKAGKKGSLEHVAELKLEAHKKEHPELHLAHATGKRTRGARDVASGRNRLAQSGKPEANVPRATAEKGLRRPHSELEHALARGESLIKKGRQVAQGTHDGLDKAHSFVAHGLEGAEEVQRELEKAAGLAKRGAGILGEDSELGKYMLDVSDKADKVHAYLEESIGLADEFNGRVGKMRDGMEQIPGVHGEKKEPGTKKGASPLEQAQYLEGQAKEKPARKSPREAAPTPPLEAGAGESDAQKSERYQRAWDKIGGISREVQDFQTENARSQKKIADTKGLGGQVAVSHARINEGTHPDIYENTKNIYAVRTKVESFGGALHDSDAHEHVKKVLEEAKQARADLSRLKAKYKGDKAATDFLTSGGTQDELIDDPIKKLEGALKGEARSGKKKPEAATGKKPAVKSVEHGLKAIEKHKKISRKIDSRLGMAGHAPKQVSQSARAGHAELVKHGAGKKSAHGAPRPKEREHLAKGGKKLTTDGNHLYQDGKKIVHDVQKTGEDAQDTWADARHLYADAQHGVEDVKSAWGDTKHAFGDLKTVWGDVTSGNLHDALEHGKGLVGDVKGLMGEGKGLVKEGQKLFGEGKGLVKDVRGLWGDVTGLFGAGKNLVTGFFGGGGQGKAEIAKGVQDALTSVSGFGNSVSDAIKDIEGLISAGNSKEAGDRVQAMSVASEQTRSEVTRAVSTSAKYPDLAEQAAAASEHYLEIRGHFFEFVKGLHGLAGQAQELQGAGGQGYPDLTEILTDIRSLQVKVDALGDVKNADSEMQKAVGDLQGELKDLRGRLDKAQSEHAQDEHAGPILEDLDDKLGQIEESLDGHADKAAARQGDKDLGVKDRKGPKDPVDHLLDNLGDDPRMFVDRGAARGDVDVHDAQEIDPRAADTWIGSGEGIKLFSQVFGAFVPAEGAVVHALSGGGPKHRGGGGKTQAPGGGEVPGGAGGGDFPLPGGMQLPSLPGMGELPIQGLAGGLPGKAKGFFKGLFDNLEGFSDQIGGWAQFGEGVFGQGMQYAEMGMHGLEKVEGAAQQVQGFAGQAEGFLDELGYDKLAGFAGRIGGAAGSVDKEAKLAQGGLETADKWLGKGKSVAGKIGGAVGGAEKAGGIFDEAAQGRFGTLVNLFKASKYGDGIDGKLVPEKMSLNSMLDEPRRLDVTTLSRMEQFLGGSFAGVRIHTGPGAAQVTSRFAAEAVTVKDHIFFAPGRFNPSTAEGQKLLAHELTHVLQKSRPNLDVRTAESEALHSERSYGSSPDMTTLNLSQPPADFKLGDGMGLGNTSGVHTAKRNRSKGHEVGGKDTLPDGEEFIEQVSGRVYDLLMEELEHTFESR